MMLLESFVISVMNSVFSFMIYVLLLWFFLQLCRADYHNPLTVCLLKLTRPIYWFEQKLKVPQVWVRARMTLILIIFLIMWGNWLLVSLIYYGHFSHSFVSLAYWLVGSFVIHVGNLFFFALIIQAILSWFTHYRLNWIEPVLYSLLQPLLSPIRKVMPTFGGIDLSPIPLLMIIKLFITYLGYPALALSKATGLL